MPGVDHPHLIDVLLQDPMRRFTPKDIGEVAGRMAVRPVFTAHPTEAARRTTLTHLKAIAAFLDSHQENAKTSADDERNLAELVELLWLTDDLRVAQPDPLDEARNALYYFDELHREVVSGVLRRWQQTLSRAGVTSDPWAIPLSFGSWIGGDRDGNPNVTADITLEVIRLQREHAVGDVLPVVDRLRQELSVSSRLRDVSPELVRSVQADLAALPEIEERYLRLNAEEPCRLKAICIRLKLLNTERRIHTSTPHVPGRDYLDGTGLLADLMVVRDSLQSHGARTVEQILWVSGQDELLERAPVLRRTLAVRAAYLAPIHDLQVSLLKRVRANAHSSGSELQRALLLTINGIAAGLRNTG